MRGLIMDYPLTIDRIIRRADRVFPDREVVSTQPSGARHRYTYSEFFRRVVRLMNVLRKLGVKPGDRVATFMWNHHRHLELYYAIPCMGAVLHTLNIRLFAEQLDYIVNHAKDSIIFVDDVLLQTLEPLAPAFKTVRQYVVVSEDGSLPETSLSPIAEYEALMADADDTEDFPQVDERDACGLCYTSGTTGNPKGVLYSHRGIYVHTLCAAMTDMLGVSGRDAVMPVVPMFHANAWAVPFTAPMMGAKLVFAGSNVSPEALLPLIREEGVTIALGVPTIWNGVLHHLREHGGDLGKVHSLVVGGSAAPRAMIDAFKQDYNVDLIHAWGMTEMSPLGSVNRLHPKMDDWPRERQLDHLSRVGVPAPIVEMRLEDDDGNELPWDGEAVGELLVRGPAVVNGYYNNTETADRFTDDGWFRTGDVATIDENGVMQIMDRTKDLIKSGGEWISSVEMENAIMALPGVVEAAVVARPDEKWDERPVAFVVMKPNANSLSPEAVIDHLGHAFAKWQLPAQEDVRFIEELPKTSVGKFDKKVLRTQL